MDIFRECSLHAATRGRRLVAAQQLKAGAVVLREAPASFVLSSDAKQRCAACARRCEEDVCRQRSCRRLLLPRQSAEGLGDLDATERLALRVAACCAPIACAALSPLCATSAAASTVLLRRVTAADFNAMAAAADKRAWTAGLPREDALRACAALRTEKTLALHCTRSGRAIGTIGLRRHSEEEGDDIWYVVRREDTERIATTPSGEVALLAEILRVFVGAARALGWRTSHQHLSARRPLSPECVRALVAAGFAEHDARPAAPLVCRDDDEDPAGRWAHVSATDVARALDLAALVGNVLSPSGGRRAALESRAARVHIAARASRIAAASRAAPPASQIALHLSQLERNAIALTEVRAQGSTSSDGGDALELFRAVQFGTAVFPARFSLLNHSCRPNCTVRFDEFGDLEAPQQQRSKRLCITVVAVRAVAIGEELTISYVGQRGAYGAERQSALRELQRQYLFTCRCSACREEKEKAAEEGDEQARASGAAARRAAVLREAASLLDRGSGAAARRAASLVARELTRTGGGAANEATLDRAQLFDALARAKALMDDRVGAADACWSAVTMLKRVYGSDRAPARALANEWFKCATVCFNARQCVRALHAIDAAGTILRGVQGGGDAAAADMLAEMGEMRRYL